ncbi:aspartate kinase [Prosthecobacter sp.]|uniref:aspartate kinase n=1 Tax=Prosthecobacter sp. TaxID=1965333 RepID=UPI001DC393F8|nr:aspartate kinase [Prosthecobacter sp.]MCB1277482.1 aspartate kinase [Prosthecobacter sp.]
MAIVVQKYGGSSVADADKIRAVARRVIRTRDLGHQVVVVVSAMGDTTDDLLQTAKKVSPNPERRELDMLLSVGERISMSLLSMAIRDLGGDAISFTGSQAGIITNDRHVDARIVEVRPFRVQDELALGKIVIIAGYQGVSYRKEVTTLGRGGSDTTAVAMAAALDAEWCEICSDVDGVYSADPRVVPQAQRIAAMSYEEMQEMAEAGAKVLNAQAVEFAKERGISIYARATAKPPPEGDSLSDGTVVRKFGPRMPGAVVGVASEKDLFVLQSTADLDALLAFLDSHQVCGKQLHLAAADGPSDGLSMVLSRENLHDEDRVRSLMAEKFGDQVRLMDRIGAASVIGTGINTSYKNLRAGSSALAAHHVVGISTSSFRITWLLHQSTLDDAVRQLHQTFLEAGHPLVP